VNASFQPFTGEEPVLVRVTSAVKPPCQTFVAYATLQAVEPPGSPEEPVLTVEENEVTARPVPFCQGSKPA